MALTKEQVLALKTQPKLKGQSTILGTLVTGGQNNSFANANYQKAVKSYNDPIKAQISANNLLQTGAYNSSEMLALANEQSIANQKAALDKVTGLTQAREQQGLNLFNGSYNESKGFLTSQDNANRASAEAAQANFNPFIQNGIDSSNSLKALMGDENSWLMNSFDSQELENDAGYQFRLAEGQSNLDNSLMAKNGLLSGAALKASNQYNQNFASNEYAAAYDRFEADKATKYGMLNNMVNQGLQGASGYAGAAYTSNLGNELTNLSQQNATNQNNLIQNTGGNLSNILMGGVATENEYRTQAASARATGLNEVNSLKAQNTINKYSLI